MMLQVPFVSKGNHCLSAKVIQIVDRHCSLPMCIPANRPLIWLFVHMAQAGCQVSLFSELHP